MLGLLLARNLFLADFFEQYQTGLTMRVPWLELGLIVLTTYVASLVVIRRSRACSSDNDPSPNQADLETRAP